MAGGDGGLTDDAFDRLTGHRLDLLRYEAGTSEAMLAAYNDALGDLDKEFARLSDRIERGVSTNLLGLGRLADLRADLDKRIRTLNRIAALTLNERLREVADAEAAFQSALFERHIGTSFGRVPEAAVATAIREPIGGKLYSDRLATDLFEAREGLQGVLARAMAKGASMPNIAKAIREGGQIVETYRGRFVAIARTETQRVANAVALATYDENADVLSGVQYLATLDSRTCLICAPLHNTVYRYVDGKLPANLPVPPRHPRCRCYLSPVSKSWADIGVKVKGNPADWTDTPAEDTTFDAWLRRKGEKVQAEILGDERRRLWLSGVPLGKFTDGRRVLRLGELRALAG